MVEKPLAKKTEGSASSLNVKDYPKRAPLTLKLIFGLVVLVLSFLSLSFVTQAAVPGNVLYPVKRFSEKTLLSTPLPKYTRNRLRAYFVGRRIDEAVAVAHSLSNEPVDEQIDNTKVLVDLLEEFHNTTEELNIVLVDQLKSNNLPPEYLVSYFKELLLKRYISLEELRLESPSVAQSEVLESVEVVQETLATIDDILKIPPVSDEDVKELDIFVAIGFLTREEFEKLVSVKSNHTLYNDVKKLVESGKLPAGAIYALQYDSIREFSADKYPRFRSSVQFDELRKVAMLTKSVQLSKEEETKVQSYLEKYKLGTPIPQDETTPFVAPLIYGLSLTTDVDEMLNNIDPEHLSIVRGETYAIWKNVDTEGLTTKEVFGKLISAVDENVERDVALLERVQLEILTALRDEVVYLALPPGWTAEKVEQTRGDFEENIADLKKPEEQRALETQVEQLAQQWANLPTQLEFNKTEFDAAKQELNNYFADLAAQLEAQYLEYHALLEADIQRLKQTTDAEIQRLQQTANELMLQLEQSKSQSPSAPVEITVSVPTPAPTSVPVASPVPVVTPTSTPLICTGPPNQRPAECP